MLLLIEKEEEDVKSFLLDDRGARFFFLDAGKLFEGFRNSFTSTEDEDSGGDPAFESSSKVPLD